MSKPAIEAVSNLLGSSVVECPWDEVAQSYAEGLIDAAFAKRTETARRLRDEVLRFHKHEERTCIYADDCSLYKSIDAFDTEWGTE